MKMNLNIRKYFNKWYKQHILKKRTDKEMPYKCITCELLGICRDRDNEWKCKKGCLIKKR